MACSCQKHQAAPAAAKSRDATQSAWEYKRPATTRPLDQCLFCAQKHADEALAAMNEFMYEQENRSFVHGAIRAVVNHTFKEWPGLAAVARDAALLWQEARFAEAQAKLREASKLIDLELLKANPEIQARLDEAVNKKETPAAETTGA